MSVDSTHWSAEWIGKSFKKYKPPSGKFNFGHNNRIIFKKWAQEYSDYFTGPTETLKIESQPINKNFFSIKIDCESVIRKKLGSQKITAKVKCKNDLLSSPVEWTYSCKTFGLDKKPVKNGSYFEKGFYKDNKLVTEAKNLSGKKELHITDPLVTDWTLFYALHKINKEKINEIKFNMLQEFLFLRKDQKIKRIGNHKFEIEDGSNLELTGYQQLGEGTIPTTYWFSQNGNLVFMITGLCYHYYLTGMNNSK